MTVSKTLDENDKKIKRLIFAMAFVFLIEVYAVFFICVEFRDKISGIAMSLFSIIFQSILSTQLVGGAAGCK